MRHIRPMSIQSALDRFTRRQYGLITRSQALWCGLTPAQIRAQLETGHWVEMRPSVYAVAGAPQSREQAVLAVLSTPARRALPSPHGTAAHHWRLKNCEQPDEIEVVSSLASGVRLDGVHGDQVPALCSTLTALRVEASRSSPLNGRSSTSRADSRSRNSARSSTMHCSGNSSLSSRSVVSRNASCLRRVGQ